MSIPVEIREASQVARGLREAATACGPGQSALKARLTTAASTMDSLAAFAIDTAQRIDQVAADLTIAEASFEALVQKTATIHAIAASLLRPPGAPPEDADGAVIVAGVNVAGLAPACRMLDSVERVMLVDDDPNVAQLIAVIQIARNMTQAILAKLTCAARAGGDS